MSLTEEPAPGEQSMGPTEEPAPGEQMVVRTYYPDLWWPRPSLEEDDVGACFLALRDRLDAAGRGLDHALPPADSSSDEEEGVVEGWALVGRLGWCLRSDNILDEVAVGRAVANLDGGSRAALRDFVTARAAELAADPYLATKSRALRLQFAALGQEWFATLRGSPALADYLEGEAQVVDLEAVLG